jgi:hypothetical protein
MFQCWAVQLALLALLMERVLTVDLTLDHRLEAGLHQALRGRFGLAAKLLYDYTS